MTFLRSALCVLVAGIALVLTATPALAHTELKSSTPADGASLDDAPTTVTLTFEEAVSLPQNPISVTGPDGSAWTVGTPTISGASVSAPVQPAGPAGRYTLRYTVTADDGDAVSGTVGFTLTGPAGTAAAAASASAASPAATAPDAAVATGTATAPSTADTSSDSGSSPWVWVAVLVVVLGVAGAGYTVARRRRGVDS